MSASEVHKSLIQDIENKKEFHKIASNILFAIIIGFSLSLISLNLVSSIIVVIPLVLVLAAFVYPILLYSYFRFNEYNNAIRGINNIYFHYTEELENNYSVISKILDIGLTTTLIESLYKIFYRGVSKLLNNRNLLIFIGVLSIYIFIEAVINPIDKINDNTDWSIDPSDVTDSYQIFLAGFAFASMLGIFKVLTGILHEEYLLRMDLVSVFFGIYGLSEFEDKTKRTRLVKMIDDLILTIITDLDGSNQFDEKGKEQLLKECKKHPLDQIISDFFATFNRTDKFSLTWYLKEIVMKLMDSTYIKGVKASFEELIESIDQENNK